MSFILLAFSVGLAQAALAATTPLPSEKRGVADGDSSVVSNSVRNDIGRCGHEYTMDELDNLEEESESATMDQIFMGIDYLIILYDKRGVDYGLMGGIALRLYGYVDRETHDSDMVVSVNSRDLLNTIMSDESIARPPPLMAASGTVRIFVIIDGQQVASDVFVQGGDQSPPLDTTVIEGYNVLKVGPLVSSKLRRASERDNRDVLWLVNNMPDDVKDAADDIDVQKRIAFATEHRDDDDNFENILETLKLSEEDIEDDDNSDDEF